jgi:hypothetical protein
VNVVGKGKGEGHLVGYVSPEGAVAVNERYVFSRKIARLAIHNFLQEQGWPTLSFDGFAALCKAADVQYGIYKREVRLDVDDTARLLRSIAEIPLADAAEGVHAADLAKALWMETSSDLLRIAKKVENNEYADAICTRRRGKQPGAYREVQFIRTAGAILLAQECLRLWPTRAALIGKSAEAIVAEIQQEYGEYMRESNLQPVLAASAIDVFIASYDTDRDEEPDTSAPEVLLVSSEPVRAKAASPLKILEDRGVRLSSYDQDWTLHAKCRNDPNPDRFVSVAAEDMTSALSTCKGCGVKGECLVRSLKMDSFGTAGNLRHKERLKLLPLLPQVEAWLQETKPGNK